ncbi:MAG: tetratricopeptide (TPR) repeat protein [Candidatus Poriferisodalaceae bacterium]|jgi:tetratricopeptide (TPR) repeat protein
MRGTDRKGNELPERGEKPERNWNSTARGAKWGGVARRAAHNATFEERGWKDADWGNAPEHDDERWERVDTAEKRRKSGRAKGPKLDLPQIDGKYLKGMTQEQRDRLLHRIRDAAEAYLGERFGEVDKALSPLVKRHPQIPELQELYGLNLYRLGRWKPAIVALEASRVATAEVDQIPALADCHRALGNFVEVERLWDELRMAGPDAAVMVEGRIVMAGAKADDGRLQDGIRLLEQGPVRANRVEEHHLRLWYALADLYDRAGEHQKARRGFQRIESAEAGYLDVAERLDALL